MANAKEWTNVGVFLVLKEITVKLVSLLHSTTIVDVHVVMAIVQQTEPADVNKDGSGSYVREVNKLLNYF